MKTARTKLTERMIRSLPLGARVGDSEVIGLQFRVYAGGRRAFVFRYTLAGRSGSLTLGEYPAMRLSEARDKARQYRVMVRDKQDPKEVLAEREAALRDKHEGPTVSDLFDEYDAKHLTPDQRRKERFTGRTSRYEIDLRGKWRNHILPRIGSVPVRALTQSMIRQLHEEISQQHPTAADRTLETLKRALNLSLEWEWLNRNPAHGVTKNGTNHRTRTLTPAERIKLDAALSAEANQSAAQAIRFAWLTGARIGEVLAARFEQFHLTDSGMTWIKPRTRTKQRKKHIVPLSRVASQIIEERRIISGGTVVFPSRDGRSEIVDLRKVWQRVLTATKLEDCHVHDLRHDFASVIASSGHTEAEVGALLGHSQAQTTRRYAHLFDQPLRIAVEAASSLMLASDRGE